MSQLLTERPSRTGSATKDWLRALELTAPIARQPERLFSNVIEELAGTLGEKPALLSDRECLSYRGLVARSNQYAKWALDQGLAKGETVCLLMPNRPEYMAVWLGITKAGGIVALLNTNLTGRPLARSIDLVTPKHVIVAAEFIDHLTAALPGVSSGPTIWTHGADSESYRRIDMELDGYTGDALSPRELQPLTIGDRALCIYTSGTTGMPKAVNISHGRLMQWSQWFAGMMDTQPIDRIYNCLPMYHSVGGVQAPGAVLLGGGSVVIRERFSASQFWTDIVRWDCTLFQYIGELCRYLLHSDPAPEERNHRIRMACGNGLRPDVWSEFQTRFGIPRIFEFYAATEGSISLFNIEGEPNSIGRVPGFLAHRQPAVLVKFDFEKQEPLRNELGFCIPCAADEVGEALGPLASSSSNLANRFEGYTDSAASERKVMTNVFREGDSWFRSGDLMRKDSRGFFYFVDRIGDTFRWKGENVAASEVSEAITALPGITQASVYGVAIPGTDGRAGMAAIVPDGELNLAAFRAALADCSPKYACPLFLRVRTEIELTSTFKYTKAELVDQGYDPRATTDAIYFNHPERDAFVRLDEVLYEQINAGEIRL
jgi:fatty-acyl-CoA synthase